MIHPQRLEYASVSSIIRKHFMLHFGPIIANTIRNFRNVEKYLKDLMFPRIYYAQFSGRVLPL